MSAPSRKIALFIDGANLYATAKSLGFDIDYKRLLREFQSRGNLLRAFYYTAVIEDQEYSSIRPLIDWLDYNGYTVVTKATKEFVDQTGRRKVKGNMDIELAVDAMELPAYRSHGVVFRRRRAGGLKCAHPHFSGPAQRLGSGRHDRIRAAAAGGCGARRRRRRVRARRGGARAALGAAGARRRGRPPADRRAAAGGCARDRDGDLRRPDRATRRRRSSRRSCGARGLGRPQVRRAP